MGYQFSFIVPVFNRPDEIDELLLSMTQQKGASFEVVIVEDGSSLTCKHIVDKYASQLVIQYLVKPNTGPGDSRNYGMQHARADFFIILDSDVLLPADYLLHVTHYLKFNQVECYGGPDLAHPDFSDLQKAIDFTMTSFLTTGGIRGNTTQIQTYEPRSFNMGISRNLFLQTNGFTNIHPGEDPDLSIRIQKLGYPTVFMPKAGVFHKRRISWLKFYQQVYKFGLVRPILFIKHPSTLKISYFFPTFFSALLLFSLALSLFDIYYLLLLFTLYFVILGCMAFLKYRSFRILFFAILACLIQFGGYGQGFAKSFFLINICKFKAEKQFPFLFYSGKNKF